MMDAEVISQSSWENGIKMRRIDEKGTPVGYAKCTESAICETGELNNNVRFPIGANVPIVIFTDPLDTCKNCIFNLYF